MPLRPRLTPAIADVRRAVRGSLGRLGSQPGESVIVAVSGGADSMALAAGTLFETARMGVTAIAVVVEHGIQPLTAQVAPVVVERLRQLGYGSVILKAVQVGTDGNLEAEARAARYAALAEVASENGAAAVLVGHTMNDQAETVLLGLARGSGPRSLAGMAEISDGLAGLKLVRPLLACTRATTEACCRDSGIEFWQDPQNQDAAFARVRVRTEVLPLMNEVLGGGVVESLARTAELLQDDLDLLDALAAEAYDRLVRAGSTSVDIKVAELVQLARPLAARVVLRVVGLFGRAATKNHVDEVLDLLHDWHGQGELALPGVRVLRHGDDLTFKSAKMLKPGAC